ncbi:hypothetical protein FOPG_10081 [Fusarium oxysporum f. sp. conglutinans race 2 54008]|uniref:Uncharacterized protein n=3 Tax=Fusarium oxysporum TaxID=5507 RepID=A0A0J9WNX4_FUSO4|nr:hypothetical protein FOXG_19983 [Fusarium oxysporum f. sp. lycopersici 4287]EXK36956.1 hypothetical protein FOMG_07840 [Fusarium oxysporum f. sp. melonis 26406]EXL74975.1 hypothetical protein FOPG_10081 [Fusarium oxysporum f. sp. conglutinans race 2 54008]KNB08037.1 hypothetical protein FOXG_19983 [Fusarium oxysporum f. sp. lycopersici 4287]
MNQMVLFEVSTADSVDPRVGCLRQVTTNAF